MIEYPDTNWEAQEQAYQDDLEREQWEQEQQDAESDLLSEEESALPAMEKERPAVEGTRPTSLGLHAADIARMLIALHQDSLPTRSEALFRRHLDKEPRKKTGPARVRRMKEKNRRAKQRRK